VGNVVVYLWSSFEANSSCFNRNWMELKMVPVAIFPHAPKLFRKTRFKPKMRDFIAMPAVAIIMLTKSKRLVVEWSRFFVGYIVDCFVYGWGGTNGFSLHLYNTPSMIEQPTGEFCFG
jgi:hypothetical protein